MLSVKNQQVSKLANANVVSTGMMIEQLKGSSEKKPINNTNVSNNTKVIIRNNIQYNCDINQLEALANVFLIANDRMRARQTKEIEKAIENEKKKGSNSNSKTPASKPKKNFTSQVTNILINVIRDEWKTYIRTAKINTLHVKHDTMEKLIKEGLKEFIVTSLIEKQYNFVDVKDEDLEDTIDIIKNKMNKENEEKVHKDEIKAFKLQQKEFVSLFKEHTKAFFGQHGLTVINKLKKSISKSMPKEWKTQVLKTIDKHDIITTTSSAQEILFAELSNLDSLNISKPEVLSSTKAEHAQEEEPSTVELDDVIPFVSEQSKNDSESFFQQANLPDDQKTVVNDNGKAPSHLLLDSSITTDTDGLNNGANKAVLIDINDFMANSSFNLDNMFANNKEDTLSVFEKSNDEYLDKDFDEYDDNSSVGNSADKDMTSEENLTPVVNFKD